MNRSIDLNCDMGEGFGAYSFGADDELLPLISSANIACGFHAGDPNVMRATVARAEKAGVAIGAHVGFPDLLGFGRRAMRVRPAELKNYAAYQIGALDAFVRAARARLRHVKPHGALYMMALEDRAISRAIAEAVREHDPRLMIYTIAGSETAREAERHDLRVVPEFFADRGYHADGNVKMFNWNIGEAGGAPAVIAQRVVRLVREGRVRSIEGTDVAARARTVCVHSDTPDAPRIARAIRRALKAAGIAVRKPK